MSCCICNKETDSPTTPCSLQTCNANHHELCWVELVIENGLVETDDTYCSIECYNKRRADETDGNDNASVSDQGSPCKRCKGSDGNLLPCSNGKCGNHVHAECAIEMKEQFVKSSRKDYIQGLVFTDNDIICSKRCFITLCHKKKKQKRQTVHHVGTRMVQTSISTL
jgi:hypothetical protein